MADGPPRGASTDDPTGGDSPERPPLGSWARLYTLVCVLAVLVMALLWWFASHYNLRLPRS